MCVASRTLNTWQSCEACSLQHSREEMKYCYRDGKQEQDILNCSPVLLEGIWNGTGVQRIESKFCEGFEDFRSGILEGQAEWNILDFDVRRMGKKTPRGISDVCFNIAKMSSIL